MVLNLKSRVLRNKTSYISFKKALFTAPFLCRLVVRLWGEVISLTFCSVSYFLFLLVFSNWV